ncbi:MAG: cation diffusion facilitator family transporter [Halanaerobiales bacterium]
MEGRNKKVRNILFVILILNFAVAALKLIFGSIIDSSSLTADAFHSFTDGFSNVIGIIGIWFASKPEDDEHPYGHNKIESLARL